MGEMNKMWVVYGGKTYESLSWIKELYSFILWPAQTPLQRSSASFLEKVRRDIFVRKADPEKKLVYVTCEHWKTLKLGDKKKVVII